MRFGEEELRHLTEVIASGRLDDSRRKGAFNRRIEQEFCRRFEVRHACTVSSATAGLHLSLLALGVGAGDEVVVDPLVKFGAAAALYCGARPVFADVAGDTFTMDPESLEGLLTRRTRAIVCTALYGLPAKLERIAEIARLRGVPLVEDCSQAILARRRGRLAGTFGAIGVFSFHATKHMSTGDGGMIVTDSVDAFDAVVALREHGWHPDDRQRSRRLGYNYRMTELAAATGLAQLSKLDRFVEHHRSAGALLNAAVADIGALSPQAATDADTHVYWKWAAAVPKAQTERLRAALAEANASFAFGLYPSGPAYLRPDIARDGAPGRGACPVAEGLSEDALVLSISYERPAAFYAEQAEKLRSSARRLGL